MRATLISQLSQWFWNREEHCPVALALGSSEVEPARLLPRQFPLLHAQRCNSGVSARRPARLRDVSRFRPDGGCGWARLVLQHFLRVPVPLDQVQIQLLQLDPLPLAIFSKQLVILKHR